MPALSRGPSPRHPGVSFASVSSPVSRPSLHVARYDSPASTQAPLILLHGFLGSGGNWHTIARRLSAHRPVWLPDARNHGRSPHAPSHTYADMADDLLGLLDAEGVAQAAVAGHSMGGKAAMHLALTHPERVERLAVLDIGPGASPGDSASVLAALAAVDLDAATDRAAVEDDLAARLPSPGLRGWLMKNLVRLPADGGFRWALNVPVLLVHQDDVSGTLEAGLPPIWRPYAGPALFVRGGRSDYLPDDAMDEIQRYFPAADLATVPNAGHWLHADNPDGLLAVMESFLGASSS